MKYRILLGILAIASLGACNLTKDVDIDLPAYDPQPVVECYLEPGKPFRLLLTQSYSFFDPLGLDSSFLEKTLLQGATVRVSYGGQTITLDNQFSFDLNPLKLYNYTNNALVPDVVGQEYTLDITLADGRTITGASKMLPLVPIDSVVVEFSPDIDTLARNLMYITDDLSTPNYYRRMLHYGNLDSLVQDFVVDDRFSTEAKVAFGAGYDLVRGDTVINTLFHIDAAYHDYIESVQLAIVGAGNPFAQPSPIKSNVSGTANPLGIFTCIRMARDVRVVQ